MGHFSVNINNQDDWPEENPHGVIRSTHQQQFSISVWARIVGDFATWAYRQPLPRFPLTCPAKISGKCTTGSQSTNVAHFSRVMRDVLNNTYHGRRPGRGGPTAWPPPSPDVNSLEFYLCMQPLFTTKRHFPITLWMHVRLSTTRF
jgi:hypothetical protein